MANRQLQGDGIDEHLAYTTSGGNAFWFLSDHLGSIRTIVDDTGATVHDYSYDGFGNVTSVATPSMYGWTGRELDAETGMQYNRARYYDSATGRWISLDPMGFDAGDSNLYRYVRNRPVIGNDPSGRDMAILVSGVHSDVEVDLWVSLPMRQEIDRRNGRTNYSSYELVNVGTLSATFGAIGFQGGDPNKKEGIIRLTLAGTSEVILGLAPNRTVNGARVLKGTKEQDVRLVNFILSRIGKGSEWLANKVQLKMDYTTKEIDRTDSEVVSEIAWDLKSLGAGGFGRNESTRAYSVPSNNCNHFTLDCVSNYVGYNWLPPNDPRNCAFTAERLVEGFDASVKRGTDGYPKQMTIDEFMLQRPPTRRGSLGF